MFRGRYGDTTGAPYVEGEVYLPRLAVGAGLSFLVDTGADRTTLMPADALIKLDLDYSRLKGALPSVGIGGNINLFREEAVLTFTDPGLAVHFYSLDIAIYPRSHALMRTPSLLGRDILNRWRMTYAPSDGQRTLNFEVLSSDLSLPLGPPG